MDRLAVLEKEINKGISVDEKSGGVIMGWSPNNVRRLIIGADKVIIQYFMTGGKYKRLFEIVPLNHDFAALAELAVKEPGKFRSILSSLVKGRVCSSVEEIFFCSPGYHPEILRRDLQLSYIASSREKAEGRFVRLRHVSKVDVTADQLWSINEVDENARRGTYLLLDAAKAQGIQVHSVYEAHIDSWWQHTSLRPRYYPFEEKLGDYFDKVKEKKEALGKIDAERTRQLETFKKAYSEFYPTHNWIITKTNELLINADAAVAKLGVLDRVEWALHLQLEYSLKYMRDHFTKHYADLYKTLRGIDFAVLRGLALELDKSGVTQTAEVDVHSSERLISMLVTARNGVSQAYVQEIRKASEREAVVAIKDFYVKAFRFSLNLLYMTFVARLSRNDVKYADYELGLLPNKAELAQVKYTRTTTEFVNRFTSHGVASDCFDVAGFTLVTEEEFTLSEASRALFTLSDALSISKEG